MLRLKHITVKSLWVQEAVYSIAVERVPSDVMHAQNLVSPSSAEELRKHLTELNACRDGEVEDCGLACDDGGRHMLFGGDDGAYTRAGQCCCSCLGDYFLE